MVIAMEMKHLNHVITIVTTMRIVLTLHVRVKIGMILMESFSIVIYMFQVDIVVKIGLMNIHGVE
jgi:hypothetical protein